MRNPFRPAPPPEPKVEPVTLESPDTLFSFYTYATERPHILLGTDDTRRWCDVCGRNMHTCAHFEA